MTPLKPAVVETTHATRSMSTSALAWAGYQGGRDPYITLISIYVFILRRDGHGRRCGQGAGIDRRLRDGRRADRRADGAVSRRRGRPHGPPAAPALARCSRPV